MSALGKLLSRGAAHVTTSPNWKGGLRLTITCFRHSSSIHLSRSLSPLAELKEPCREERRVGVATLAWAEGCGSRVEGRGSTRSTPRSCASRKCVFRPIPYTVPGKLRTSCEVASRRPPQTLQASALILPSLFHFPKYFSQSV